MTQTFHCTGCGAPNKPEAGQTSMACAYCGITLTIPEELRTRATPRVEKIQSKATPAVSLEKEAPELLRKAQPLAIKAWNMYAYWTWVRWVLPTCLTIFVVGFFICMALGALPFVFNLFR